jgi:hypothetical protein
VRKIWIAGRMLMLGIYVELERDAVTICFLHYPRTSPLFLAFFVRK